MYRPYYKPVNKTKPTRKSEEMLQLHVCQYLRSHYPNLIFRSDFASGLYLSPFQASKHAKLQSGRSWPDLAIYAPSADGKYNVMFLELKREGVRVYLKNGELSSDPHVQEQAAMLRRLRDQGFYAEFAVGYEGVLKQVHQYLGEPIQEQFDF